MNQQEFLDSCQIVIDSYGGKEEQLLQCIRIYLLYLFAVILRFSSIHLY